MSRPADPRARVKLVDLWLEADENPLATMWAIDTEGRLWRRHRNEFGAWSQWSEAETPLEPKTEVT